MAEEFKGHLEKFLLDVLGNIGEPSLITKFQDEYDKLMDEFIKLNFVAKEKIDSIVEDSLSDAVKQINELKEEKMSLAKQNTELIEKNKLLNIKNEEIAQKFSVLEKSLNKSTNDLKNIKVLEQKLNELQADYDLMKSKYDAKNDEISMYKKNLKKYYTMEKEINQLTLENEKLSVKMRDLSSADNYKLKFEEISQINEKMKVDNININKQNNKSKQEIESLKTELEQAKEKLDKTENEKKLKNYQLEEKIKENIKIINEKEDIMNKIKEAEYNLKTNKIIFSNFSFLSFKLEFILSNLCIICFKFPVKLSLSSTLLLIVSSREKSFLLKFSLETFAIFVYILNFCNSLFINSLSFFKILFSCLNFSISFLNSLF